MTKKTTVLTGADNSLGLNKNQLTLHARQRIITETHAVKVFFSQSNEIMTRQDKRQ